jgi:hypothetical protein
VKALAYLGTLLLAALLSGCSTVRRDGVLVSSTSTVLGLDIGLATTPESLPRIRLGLVRSEVVYSTQTGLQYSASTVVSNDGLLRGTARRSVKVGP